MPDRDPERIKIAARLLDQIAQENKLTPVQARAFVRGLQTGWHVPIIQWREDESRMQYLDAKRLLNAASIFRQVEGSSSENSQVCYRRAGEVLEWLSRAGDNLSSYVPIELLAAASYQLGAIPAMASALLAQAEQNDSGVLLYARFLRADFDGVIQSVTKFWLENLDITDRYAHRRLILEEGDDKVSWYFTVELVRSLGLMADSLRRGDSNRFELAKRKLAALDKVANRTFADEVSLLVSLFDDVAAEYGENNIYQPIKELGELNPDRADRLERFARGQFSRGRGILWTSQRQGIARLLQEESFALCTPTGSGKTLVANLAIVKELLLKADDGEGPIALYLVPSRALASEVEAKLSSELSNDVIVTGLYGGTDWGVTDYWLNATEPTVLIATVEKADALMRFIGPILLRRLRLLIVDETHQVVPEDNERTQNDFAEHSCRSLRLESFVSKLLSCAPGVVRIALTAVAGGAAQPVARWIEGREDAVPIGTNYRSTRQIIGSFETAPLRSGRMLLEILNGRPLFVRGRDEPVYISLRTPPMPILPAVMRNSIYRFNQLDVLWTALHLAEGGRRILISIAQQPEQTMRWYTEALLLPSWADAPKLHLPDDEEDLHRFENTLAACIDYCGEDSFEVALLNHGIASNHGQMPQRIRRLMVDLIESGICPITIATATLTEGVNLPFDMIFVPSLIRRSFNQADASSEAHPLSTAEFRNLAGRAGRPGGGNGLEGITLVPIPSQPSTTARGNLQTQRRQIENMREDWRSLRQALLAEEIEHIPIDGPLALLLEGIAARARDLLKLDGDRFLDWLERVSPPEISDEAGCASLSEMARLADSVDELDGILVGALVELDRIDGEGLEGAGAETALSAIWQNTFTVFASAQEEWMEKAFIRRGQAIAENIYPDREERSRLYQYGFTPYVGRRFEGVFPVVVDRLREAADYGEINDSYRLALFKDLGGLLSQDPGFGFRVRPTKTDQVILDNWQEVLNWWMRGPDHEAPDPKDLRSWQRFVSDNLEFRLGVGLGAVVARVWLDGARGELIVPSLDMWKETTELPWFGFWARELLRWGTLDPFVAFALAEGMVKTRNAGAQLREVFNSWLKDLRGDVSPEDSIDPRLFLTWRASREKIARRRGRKKFTNVTLIETSGKRGRYSVIPIVSDEVVYWLDPAGFAIARSNTNDLPFHDLMYRQDFQLETNQKKPIVSMAFGGV